MKLRHPVRALCMLAILAGSLGGVAPASAAGAPYRNVTNVAPGHVVWIHSRPNTASPRVGYLKAGALRVRTMNCKKLGKGGWCQVVRRGTRGWVPDHFLKADTVMRS